MKHKNVLVGVTGSVACYKALDLIRLLKEKDISAHVVLTREAEEFVKPILFQSIAGNKAVTYDMFKVPENWENEHVSLAKKMDLIVIAPATANIIAKVAAGICDDMLTCVICASRSPVLFIPAMNEGMFNNRIVQDNIVKLKKYGYYFTGPIRGKLACGDKGIGHIQNMDKIIEEIESLLLKS